MEASDDFIFGYYPVTVGARTQDSIYVFINDIERSMEGKKKIELEDSSYLEMVFPVGEGDDDFFLNQINADEMCYMDDNWTVYSRKMSEDGKNYIVRFIPNLTKKCSLENEVMIGCICSLRLTKIIPNGKEGTAKIQLHLNLDHQEYDKVLQWEKVDNGMVVRKFYAEPYCAAQGETVVIYWNVDNGDNLSLYFDGRCIKSGLKQSGKTELILMKSGSCQLFSNQMEVGTFPLQILPVHMERFAYLEGEVYWDVYGAEQVQVDHVTVNAHGSKSVGKESGENIICNELNATGGGRSIYSRVMKQNITTDIGGVVNKLQKTIIDFGEYQILNVNWDTDDLQKLYLMYQDYERGIFYYIKGVGKKYEGLDASGSWEQIIFGNKIKITLEAVKWDGTSFYMTI